jgi:hypothetical protein
VVSGLLASLVYLGVACFVLAPDALWSPDEGAKLLQLQHIHLENGGLAYDIPYPARDLDPNMLFVSVDPKQRILTLRGGTLYLQRLFLFPLLVLPLFRLFGPCGLYVVPAIAAALCGVFALKLLAPADRRLGMWVLIAFGSPIFIYATLFWEHTLAACLGLVSAWLALRMGPETEMRSWHRLAIWLLIAALLGASIFLRLEMAIFALALLSAYWLIVRHNRWGPVLVFGTLALALVFYAVGHQTLFGQTLPDNALFVLRPFWYLKRAGWQAFPDLLLGPFRDGAIDPGWLGGLWVAAAIVAVAHSFGPSDSSTVSRLRLAALGATIVIAAVFLFNGTAYRSAHGLLFTTPWALLGFCRAREVWQRGNWRARFVVLCALLGLLGYTIGMIVLRGASPHGGLEWGARFAMVFYPLLALIAAWDLGPMRRNPTAIAVLAAFTFLGIAFQVRGIWSIGHDKQIGARLTRAVVETPEQHVVSDLWWLPLIATPIDDTKAILVATTLERMETWVEVASNRQIQRFALVTLDRNLPYYVTRGLDEHGLRVVDVRQLENLFIFRLVIEPKLQ